MTNIRGLIHITQESMYKQLFKAGTGATRGSNRDVVHTHLRLPVVLSLRSSRHLLRESIKEETR